MKKFLIFVIPLGIIIFLISYASTRMGFYLDLYPNAPVTAQFMTKENKIIQVMEDGSETEFIIKGVDVSSSMPEHSAMDFAPKKSDYLRWFAQISQMGANTIRVIHVMDDDFYNALYEFNTKNEKQLYLLQGISVLDAVNYGKKDAYNNDFFGYLVKNGKMLVDIIHGKRIVPLNQTGGTGEYQKDISDWLLGYLVGTEWSADTIAYTNHHIGYSGVYQGEYFFTTEDAKPFEAMLAEIMDKITAYESKKYKVQHLIGFINDPSNDPFEYADTYHLPMDKFQRVHESTAITYARQLGKINQLDAEHIKSTDKMKAGSFAAYRLYHFCPDFYKYLSEDQKKEIAVLLENIDVNRSYEGYLDLLGAYHSMPVVGAGYGFSTSRGVLSEEHGEPLTEQEQGIRLMEVYQDMIHANWSGGFITSWQDQWERRSWNTAYAQDLANNMDWKDLQTDGQGYGLMEFTASDCEINGNISEWAQEDIVVTSDDITLSSRVDAEGLCIMVQGENVKPEIPLYIPIDTTQESGSTESNFKGLTFSRPADFLLCLSGVEESRLLVQSRYESVRENFLEKINGENPFIEWPETDDKNFVPIYIVMENKNIVNYVNYKNRHLKWLPQRETGKFRHGNNDPKSDEYDSQADFCYGENCVEVRIPWLLLNISNPSKMLIHQDYYKNYGVKFKSIKECWIGVSDDITKTIEMQPFRLTWKHFQYKEALKQSYYIVKSVWG